ncbi:DUF2283 domain-containing protein [Microbispora sp. NPDC046933]|uniref:DUF2283 domain-containing protein n=1 Tax=Microbispora sp. NPDC046933 TaxID=3155618 RepID=UPI0033E239A8
MRIEHDRENDVAYVYLVDRIDAGEAETQVQVEADELRGEIVLDLDRNGTLLGIEIIGASYVLRPEVLAQAGDGSDGGDDSGQDGGGQDDGPDDRQDDGGVTLPPYEPGLR